MLRITHNDDTDEVSGRVPDATTVVARVVNLSWNEYEFSDVGQTVEKPRRLASLDLMPVSVPPRRYPDMTRKIETSALHVPRCDGIDDIDCTVDCSSQFFKLAPGSLHNLFSLGVACLFVF